MIEGEMSFMTDLGAITGLLDGLADRSISGSNAKEEVKLMLRSLVGHDQEIFINILKKDLRCGISTVTINDAIPELIQEFGIMKAKPYEEKRFVKGMYMLPEDAGTIKIKITDLLSESYEEVIQHG